MYQFVSNGAENQPVEVVLDSVAGTISWAERLDSLETVATFSSV